MNLSMNSGVDNFENIYSLLFDELYIVIFEKPSSRTAS